MSRAQRTSKPWSRGSIDAIISGIFFGTTTLLFLLGYLYWIQGDIATTILIVIFACAFFIMGIGDAYSAWVKRRKPNKQDKGEHAIAQSGEKHT